MRAIVLHERGTHGPRLTERAVPERPADGVLVRMLAASVNRVDLYMRDSGQGITHDLPLVMGVDGVGEVLETGPGSAFRAGDRVILYPYDFCGRCRHCLAGDQPLCLRARIFGEHIDGTFTEVMAVPERALLPLSPGAIRWPGPDWLMALTLAWVLRRPEQLPVLSVAAVMLLADVLFLRPIGLGAAIAVVATEAARRRETRWAEQGFVAEWLRVGALVALGLLAERVVMTLFVIPPALAPLPPLGQDILRLIATLAAYPLVVVVLRAFGLRRAAPGEMDLA